MTDSTKQKQDDFSDMDDLEYGEPLGYFHGVTFNSNLSPYFFSGTKVHYNDGESSVYLGFGEQCVCGYRRFLLHAYGCMSDEVDRASEVFTQKEVTSVETGDKHEFISCPNGTSSRLPRPCDTIIWPYTPDLSPWGHIAIIAHTAFTLPELANGVDIANSTDNEVNSAVAKFMLALAGKTELIVGECGIAEQNWENKSWNGKHYGRLVPLHAVLVDGTVQWKLVEPAAHGLPDPLGWKKLDSVPLRPAVGAPRIKITKRPGVIPPPRPLHWGRIDTPLALPRISASSSSSEGGGLSAELQEVEALYRQQVLASVAEAKSGGSKSSNNNDDIYLNQLSSNFLTSKPRPSAEWASVAYVNNEQGTNCFGASMCLARTLHRSAAALIPSLTASELVGTLGVPQSVVDRRGGRPLHSGDDAHDATTRCLLGAFVIGWCPQSRHWELRRSQLDSLFCFSDNYFYSDQYRKDAGGGTTSFGFAPHPGVGEDFCRHARAMFRHHHTPNTQRNLLFIDWGPADELFGAGVPSQEAKRAYEQERCHSLTLYHSIVGHIADKKASVAKGESKAEEIPRFTPILVSGIDALHRRLVVVKPDEEDNSSGMTNAKVELRADGGDNESGTKNEPVQLIWKSVPWAVLFHLQEAAGSGKAAELARTIIDLDMSKHATVQPPLWAHVASHPAFEKWLRTWGKSLASPFDVANDAAALPASPGTQQQETGEEAAARHAHDEEDQRAARHLASASASAGMIPRLDPSDAMPSVKRTTGGEKKEDDGIWWERPGSSEVVGHFYAAQVVYASCHLRSATCAVEARLPKSTEDAPAALPVEQVLQPASSIFVLTDE